jgi:hypothetical protein
MFPSLSQQLVASLTREEGHLVPKGVEEQICGLQSFRSSLDSEYRTLKKAYESYVRFCRAVGTEPEEINSEEKPEPEFEYTRAQALRDEMELKLQKSQGKGTSHEFEDILIGFAGIQRLRDMKEALREIDTLIGLLSGVVEWIAKAARGRDEEVRLLVTSSGNLLSFRLVYDVRSSASYVG